MKKHRMRLVGGKGEGEGVRISSDVLVQLLAGLKDGAQKALRLRVEGHSVRKGPKPGWLEAAGAFHVTGLTPGSTVLDLEAPTLGELLPEAFDTEDQDTLFEPDSEISRGATSLDVFADTLRAAKSGDPDATFADRALLDACYSFSQLAEGYEAIEFGSAGEVVVALEPSDVNVLRDLVESTPEPQAVRVTGRLDTISATRPQAVFVLADGTRARGLLQDHSPELLRSLFGKPVLLSGIASFRPSGKICRVEVEFIRAAEEADEALWARTPRPARSTPLFEAVSQDSESGVSAFFGTWPGEESDEELLDALKQLG